MSVPPAVTQIKPKRLTRKEVKAMRAAAGLPAQPARPAVISNQTAAAAAAAPAANGQQQAAQTPTFDPYDDPAYAAYWTAQGFPDPRLAGAQPQTAAAATIAAAAPQQAHPPAGWPPANAAPQQPQAVAPAAYPAYPGYPAAGAPAPQAQPPAYPPQAQPPQAQGQPGYDPNAAAWWAWQQQQQAQAAAGGAPTAASVAPAAAGQQQPQMYYAPPMQQPLVQYQQAPVYAPAAQPMGAAPAAMPIAPAVPAVPAKKAFYFTDYLQPALNVRLGFNQPVDADTTDALLQHRLVLRDLPMRSMPMEPKHIEGDLQRIMGYLTHTELLRRDDIIFMARRAPVEIDAPIIIQCHLHVNMEAVLQKFLHINAAALQGNVPAAEGVLNAGKHMLHRWVELEISALNLYRTPTITQWICDRYWVANPAGQHLCPNLTCGPSHTPEVIGVLAARRQTFHFANPHLPVLTGCSKLIELARFQVAVQKQEYSEDPQHPYQPKPLLAMPPPPAPAPQIFGRSAPNMPLLQPSSSSSGAPLLQNGPSSGASAPSNHAPLLGIAPSLAPGLKPLPGPFTEEIYPALFPAPKPAKPTMKTVDDAQLKAPANCTWRFVLTGYPQVRLPWSDADVQSDMERVFRYVAICPETKFMLPAEVEYIARMRYTPPTLDTPVIIQCRRSAEMKIALGTFARVNEQYDGVQQLMTWSQYSSSLMRTQPVMRVSEQKPPASSP